MMPNLGQLMVKLAVVVLFVFTLAIVLIFANGYSYDFVGQEFRRTGGVDLLSDYKDAAVYLDGKKLDGVLPFVANNIIPGKYNLAVAKDGFWNWQREIKITEDFVLKIDDIVLFPIKAEQYARNVLEIGPDAQKSWLKGGYFFIQTGNKLAYGKLKPGFKKDDLKMLNLPEQTFTAMEVWNNSKGVMNFAEKGRYLLDLSEAKLEKIYYSDNYMPVQDKWIEWNKGYLAIFDQNLHRILDNWEFEKKNIQDVKYLKLNQGEFLKIKFIGSSAWTLYKLENGQLNQVLDRVIDGPWDFNEKSGLAMVEGNELWTIDTVQNANKDRSHFWKRFYQKVKVLAVLNKTNSLLVSMNGKIMIIDSGMTNYFDVLADHQIIDLVVDQDNEFYYLENIPGDTKKIALSYLDWHF